MNGKLLGELKIPDNLTHEEVQEVLPMIEVQMARLLNHPDWRNACKGYVGGAIMDGYKPMSIGPNSFEEIVLECSNVFLWLFGQVKAGRKDLGKKAEEWLAQQEKQTVLKSSQEVH